VYVGCNVCDIRMGKGTIGHGGYADDIAVAMAEAASIFTVCSCMSSSCRRESQVKRKVDSVLHAVNIEMAWMNL
jgi:hypothetical protein